MNQCLRLGLEQDHGGDRTRTGQHGDGQWRDGDVLLGGPGIGFLLGFVHPRPLGIEHVEGDEQQDHAASHLERGNGDPQEMEDPVSGQREGDEQSGADRARQP